PVPSHVPPDPIIVPGTKGGAARYLMTSDLETAIAGLPEVRGVHIVTSGGNIEEVHVMSVPDVNPKKLVRNIITLLLVRYGVRIDYRCLSIIQSNTQAETRLARPVVRGIHQAQDAGMRVVTGELLCAGQIVIGASRLDENVSELQSGSLAVIDALEKLVGHQGQFELRETKLLTVQGYELILTLVVWHNNQTEEVYVGAGFSGSDLVASAV